MNKLLRALSLACACALLIAATPAWADAPKPQDLAEARTRYKKGLELYQEGAFDAALIELQRAYDLAPSYKILYNIGLVDLQLNDYAAALKTFRKYLEEGGKKLGAKRRSEVEKEVEKLESRVATVTLSTKVEGAEVMVDDLLVGQTPLEQPLLVNAGKRKITLAKDGYVSVSRVVVVAGGDSQTLDLALRSVAEVQAQKARAKGDGNGKKGQPKAEDSGRPVPWLWWGVAGGLAAGTAVAGVLTLGAQSDLDNQKERPAGKPALDDAASKTRTLAIVTDVFLIGTAAVGGYAAYLTFFDDPKDDPKKDAKPEKTSLSVGIGPSGVSVGGTF